jgi:hypothetical protein
MKLLKKSEIQEAKASDLRREAEEGLKLARRVDSLRETQAQEEESLRLFRENTLKQIHADTKEAAEACEKLLAEVKDLEDRRKEALRPITEEQEEINRQKAELENTKGELADERRNLDSLRESTRADAEATKSVLERVKSDHLRSDIALREASTANEEARVAREQAYRERSLALQFKKETEDELEVKKIQATATEERQKARDAAQDKRERELNARETKLADREQKLLRTIKRHG